jgi:RNA polymerase sigma-70 factor, ECF subfamily
MIKTIQNIRKSKRPFFNSDKKIIEEFVQGSPRAFQEIYLRFRKPVLNLVSTRIRNLNIAEELVQETFLKIFRYREQYNPQYEFSTWVWTIAKNLTVDYLTNSNGDPLGSRPHQELGLELQDIACNRGCAETEYLKKSERRRLFKMMKKLPKLQRKAILLRAIKGLSYDEIASSLKLSLSAVKSLIHRGKISLQTVMDTSIGSPILGPS